ncbi:sodium channel protein 60E-like isoform X3 [Aphis craccivora]|uniref:Sodium channel protein 60E-like isoform X3 n=1 Tax=Aphis craccivora TaxID=307492 RepID=A0A6G0Z4N7_APHCR|nr:sodium channel protein 60E-like isoform X3 [Aphis craccivora]
MCITFCVVSKRFRKNYIHRFTATQSFFMFSPWNSFRQLCIYISTNQIFDYVVMTTILLNCVFLAKTDSVEEADWYSLCNSSYHFEHSILNMNYNNFKNIENNLATFLESYLKLFNSCLFT